MKILLNYFKSAGYNISRNKIYALFYILGTAFTFVFIILVLQISHLITHADPPFINTQRTIHIGEFVDTTGEEIGGIELQDIANLVSSTHGAEDYAISNQESVNAKINGRVRPVLANYVNAAYFRINEFDFISGRAFTLDGDAPQHAVITKDTAEKYFHSDALGQKLSIQGNIYEVIGIVENYSSLLNPHEKATIWLPYKYNRFVPSGGEYYSIDILFSQNMLPEEMKSNLNHSLTQYFSLKGADLNPVTKNLATIQEEKSTILGGRKLAYGITGAILLLLLIPALNIMTLSLANVYNRALEIAIHRAMGANKLSSFMQIVAENLILVFAGLLIALVLIKPVFRVIESIFFSSTFSASAIASSQLSWVVVLSSVALAVLFTILSGGIPAYVISNKNIANTLKGGTQ